MMHGGIKGNNVSGPCLCAEALLNMNASDDIHSLKGPLKIGGDSSLGIRTELCPKLAEDRLGPNVF